MREFLTGNDAIVRGALKAGCNFFAGYPITPASSILSRFVDAFADGRGIAVQTEDEIAAIGQCIGAAMAGAKALTASSGPGLSLYSENIGLAQMGEVPIVVVDCQRMGPATGGATATGEGDVLFARHVTSGGYPIPVLAATDAASAYRLTFEAFNIAERLRTPVLLLASKDISLTRQTVDLDEVRLRPRFERASYMKDNGYRPYFTDDPAGIPEFAPIGGPHRVRFTGSIHGDDGLLTIDRSQIARKLRRLNAKIESARSQLEYVDADIDPDADVLVISYGASDGAARDAVDAARAQGRRVSLLTLYSLWPVPVDAIRRAVTHRVHEVVVPELNIGLYVEEIRKVIRHGKITSITRFDGGLITPKELRLAVQRGLCG